MAAVTLKRLAQKIFWYRKIPLVHRLIKVIGRHSYAIENIKLIAFSDENHLRIGFFCSISGDVTVLLGGDHRTDWATTYPFGHINQLIFPNGFIHGTKGHPSCKSDVIIEDDTWIGYGTTILSGVTLGTRCCIGARSVVTKDIPPLCDCRRKSSPDNPV